MILLHNCLSKQIKQKSDNFTILFGCCIKIQCCIFQRHHLPTSRYSPNTEFRNRLSKFRFNVPGRNSVINTYQLDSNRGVLSLVSSDKVPFTWLVRLHSDPSSTLLFAFSGTNFVIWDYRARRTVFERDIGGGHRSWDLYVDDNTIELCYIKDKTVNDVTIDRSQIEPITVLEGYHATEINVVKHIKLNGTEHLIISGGEDTMLRLSTFGADENLRNVTTLKSHLSSVKALAVTEITRDENALRCVVFSAGGRGQIIMWELDVAFGTETRVVCKEIFSHYKPNSDRNGSESRIMDVHVTSLDGNLIVFTACSNGAVQAFEADVSRKKLELLEERRHKSRCILKLFCFEVESRHVLCTTATDGFVDVWDVSDLCNRLQLHESETLFDNSRGFTLVSSIKAHLSGVNGFAALALDKSSMLFLSGGDDSSFKLHLVDFTVNDDCLTADVVTVYSNDRCHCAQISGVLVRRDYFITVGQDQRVILHRYKLLNDGVAVDSFALYDTSVCDALGLECLKATEQDINKVLVYGKGIEVISVNV